MLEPNQRQTSKRPQKQHNIHGPFVNPKSLPNTMANSLNVCRILQRRYTKSACIPGTESGLKNWAEKRPRFSGRVARLGGGEMLKRRLKHGLGGLRPRLSGRLSAQEHGPKTVILVRDTHTFVGPFFGPGTWAESRHTGARYAHVLDSI